VRSRLGSLSLFDVGWHGGGVHDDGGSAVVMDGVSCLEASEGYGRSLTAMKTNLYCTIKFSGRTVRVAFAKHGKFLGSTLSLC